MTATPTHTPPGTRAAAPSEAPQSSERSAGPRPSPRSPLRGTVPADPGRALPRTAGSSSRWVSPPPC